MSHRPSSPVSHVTKLYAEHLREDVSLFALPNIERRDLSLYVEYLNLGLRNLDNARSRIHWQNFTSIKDHISFIKSANEISKYVHETVNLHRREATSRKLVFKIPEHTIQPKHVTDTQCKPDIVAAFEDDWQGSDSNQVKAWPLIQLTGEIASKGKTVYQQRRQAAAYLHYHLLARPDLYVAHGLLITRSGVTFLAGIGGEGKILDIELPFSDGDLCPLLYALIHHIYEPGASKDSTIKITFDPRSQTCLHTLTLKDETKSVECPNFRALYASSPFSTRTHVFVIPEDEENLATIINGERLHVVKEQYCRRNSRFNEAVILKHIHKDGLVPGVIRLLNSEVVATSFFQSNRIKRRFGFRQIGARFMRIDNVETMLEVAFDVLEVTRYLRLKHKVLHRDISSGNVLWNPNKAFAPDNKLPNTTADNECGQDELDLCFIGYLRGRSSNPEDTAALLIDFNRAEQLQDDAHSEAVVDRTGTPIFIARAVEGCGPHPTLPTKFIIKVPAMPEAPSIYKQVHPQRIDHFKDIEQSILDSATATLSSSHWHHELYHDAESIFWLIFYWLVRAQPTNSESQEEPILSYVWSQLTGDYSARHFLIQSLTSNGIKALHSSLHPVSDLIANLADIINADPLYMPVDDPRSSPEYAHEAFQRTILQFIIDNQDKEFMKLPVKGIRRSETASPNQPLSSTTAQISYLTTPSESRTSSKRASPVPENEQSQSDDHDLSARSKRPRRGSGNPQPELFVQDEML